MASNIGAQLVKSLSFEVEAIPQDNAIELKKTTNMTPLNVKVRVRKKDDGHSLLRKGIISVPRIDQPDSPIEKLRLASSDQTIMSFNMVLEADLEKKVVRKSKKYFFGICLGVQEDNDDTQYLPSTNNIDQDSKSDTGVVKLKSFRPKPVADDIISSNSSKKKDKIFGKCKPGGCLDPPFGEDRYAYQPQPLHFKAPATNIDDAQTDISTKKKQKVESVSLKPAVEQNQDKSILSLYQGESGAAIQENDSESIITYPTGISSSGLILADEKNGKNVARKTSGARNSRKSFNEFSSNEYFSPPRASRDSSKSDKEKNLLTKELLSPRDAKAISPSRYRYSVENSGSQDLGLTPSAKDENHDDNTKTGISSIPDNSLVQKPVLRTTSEGLISELFSDIEKDSERKSWDKTATAAGLVGATAAGIVGFGLQAKKETDKPVELEEKPLSEYNKSRDFNEQRPDLSFKLSDNTSKDLNADRGFTPSDKTLVDSSANQRGRSSSHTRKSINQHISGQLASTGMENIGDFCSNLGPELDSQRKENRPDSGTLQDFTSSGMATRVGSDIGYSQKSSEIYKGFEKITEGYENDVSPIRRVMSDGVEKGPASRAETMTSGSERGFTSIKSINSAKTSNEIDTNEKSPRSFVPNEADSNLTENVDNDLLPGNQEIDRGTKSEKLSTENSVESYEKRIPLTGARMTDDDRDASSTEKKDASVVSDIIKSPSDIISQYRDNKTLIRSPVLSVDIQPTDNTLKQAGKKLDDWGSDGNKESIFLNLAFETYLDENQTAVRTLDSSEDQDSSNVVLVKSLLRAQDKKGITVPLDSKNVMNIVIKPAPPAQKHKSKPKSISKLEPGKSDYSNTTISLKDISSDPHAMLSSVFHQELVPLQDVIKSLKEDIDSLAAQQMMLRNRLESGATRNKPFVPKKCCCPKKSWYKN